MLVSSAFETNNKNDLVTLRSFSSVDESMGCFKSLASLSVVCVWVCLCLDLPGTVQGQWFSSFFGSDLSNGVKPPGTRDVDKLQEQIDILTHDQRKHERGESTGSSLLVLNSANQSINSSKTKHIIRPRLSATKIRLAY